MDARAIYDQLQPLTLVVRDRISWESRTLLNRLAVIRQEQQWDKLDGIAAAVEGLKHRKPDYPVLLLYLADSLTHAGKLTKAADCVSEAQGILQSEMAAEDQQNKAAASLYQGLVQHTMNRLSDAVPAYDEARFQFRQAGLAWQQAAPTDARIEECRQAASQLETCVREVLLSPTARTQPGPRPATGWSSPPEIVPLARRTFSLPPATPYHDIVALAAVVAVATVIFGIIGYTFGGLTGLLAFLATWAGICIAALIIARTFLGGEFRLTVPYEHAAVVEERGQIHVIGRGDPWLLIPGRRVRAIVPLTELSHVLRKQKVPLGASPGSGSTTNLRLTIQIGYQIADPEPATLQFDRALRDKGDSRNRATPADLKVAWESQLVTELTPLLVDELWGHPPTECLEQREVIQTNLRRLLARKTQVWGANITKLTIMEMEVQ